MTLQVLAQTQAWLSAPSYCLSLWIKRLSPGAPFLGMIIIYTQPPSLQKAGCRLSGLSLGTGHNERRGHLATPNWETRLLTLSSLSTRLKWIEQTLQKGTPLGFRSHFPFFFGFKHYMVESEGSHPRSQLGALSKGPLGRLLHLSQFSLCLPPITFETSELNKPTFLLGEIASPK